MYHHIHIFYSYRIRCIITYRPTLTVKLLSASNLKGNDFLSNKADPFVEMRLAGRTQKSRTIKRTTNPMWGELHSL
jgi:Ca2+-dependent lipid-binding protein